MFGLIGKMVTVPGKRDKFVIASFGDQVQTEPIGGVGLK